jgi:drug/metabolite transporter (DMT)-like permease
MTHPAARGILMMIAAVGSFSLMDAAMKHLGQQHSPMQVAFLRGAASLPVVLLFLGVSGRLKDLRPVRWPLHLLRGLLSVGLLWTFVFAVQVLSLADAYSIFLSAPLLITALSVPLLGEKVSGRHWLAICVGLLGVIVMLRPTAAGLVTLGGMAAFLAALLYALGAISISILSRTDTTASMVFWTTAIIAVAAGFASFTTWTPLKPDEGWWILGLGVAGAAGQHFITQAFRLAPASVVAPFEYTALLWGIGLDWVLWSVLPGSRMLAGASVVVLSGLYLMWHSRGPQGARV